MRRVLLGAGYTLMRLALREGPSHEVVASTRDPERRARLESAGVRVLSLEEALRETGDAEVVISVPPEAGRDAEIASALRERPPHRIVYLSSTGVYAALSGVVDEDSPVDHGEPRAKGRLEAEALYRHLGGIVLRVAGIYGPGRGLHERLRAGTWRIPGDGSGHVSRVHVDDLVSAIVVALARVEPGSVLCVGDDHPATHLETTRWLCDRLGLPMPPLSPLSSVHASLRGDRLISNRRLRALGWTPRYPSFREGYEALWAEEAATASSS